MNSPLYDDWGFEAGLSPLDIETRKWDPLISEPTERGTPKADLVDAIWKEDLAACTQLLDAHPELLNATLRHWGHLKSRDSRIGWPDMGTDSTDDYFRDVSPVVLACLLPRFKQPALNDRTVGEANLSLIRLFVKRGAVLDWKWKREILADVCWIYDSPEVMAFLVDIGAEMLYGGNIGGSEFTLLQLAAKKGRLGAVQFLLDHDASLAPEVVIYDSPNSGPMYSADGTPLSMAAEYGRHLVVELFLRRGASEHLEATNFWGQTALGSAVDPSYLDGVSRDVFNPEDRERIVRMLIEAGAQFLNIQVAQQLRIVTPDPGPCTPASVLKELVTWGGPDIIRYVVQQGCSVHERIAYGQRWFSEPPRGILATPLHRAAEFGHVNGVRTLIELGADINALDDFGQTPLHWAAMSAVEAHKERIPSDSYEGIMDHLLLHGAKVNQQDRFGRTPLHYITDVSLSGLITLLVGHGADLTLVDTDGRSFFHGISTISWDARQRTDQELFEPDADFERFCASLKMPLANKDSGVLNELSNAGETALHVACDNLFIPAVDLLLRLGADPNIIDASGSTALHRATKRPWYVESHGYGPEICDVWMKRFARVRALLLDAGADEVVTNREGETPRSEAAIREELVLLREKWLLEQEEARRLEELRWREGGGGRGRGWGRGIAR